MAVRPLLASLAVLAACGGEGDRSVTLYCALDMEHSSQLVREFEARTGLKVKAEYDRELNKTVGLVAQIVEEATRPRCDVFWNNECVNTIKLMGKGLLAPYLSPAAADIPAAWKDREGRWAGFAARARVLIVNTQKLPDPAAWPRSVKELADPRWRGRCALARPRTGTTLTHFAALFFVLGEAEAEAFCRAILANEAGLAQGNAHVMRQVADGAFAWGLTDTDDAHVAKLGGKPVATVYPDQDGLGTMLIPNTVCMIQGGPNPEGGRRLVDFILSREVEERLAAAKSAQIPLRPGVAAPAHVKSPAAGTGGEGFKAMAWDPVRVGKELDRLAERLVALFP